MAKKKTGNPVGRPSSYSDEIADEFCQRIMAGRNMIAVCEDEDMPHYSAIARWVGRRPDFAMRIIQAREILGERFAEMALAEAASVTDKDEVPVAALKIRTWMWAASKYAPKTYSDKVSGILASQLNVQINNNDNRSVSLSHMTMEEKVELKRLLEKAKTPIGLVEDD